jgi:hypothetical protein
MVPRSVPCPNPAADIHNRSAKPITQVNAILYFKGNLPPQNNLGTMYHNRKANTITNKPKTIQTKEYETIVMGYAFI